jgi:S-adenosylmethionine synthetase
MLNEGKHIFTSESVTEGHPDKVCDQISDAILDAILKQDPNARVACETMITQGQAIISGEITTIADIEYESIVLKTLREIGYTTDELGATNTLNKGKQFLIQHNIVSQSPHIAQGVDEFTDHEQGAGDQGLMFGFACDETPELMPLPIQLSQKLAQRLSNLRKTGKLNWLKPDGKSQVSVEYNDRKPIKVSNVVIATQHKDMLNMLKTEEEEHKFITENITKQVIKPVLDEYGIDYDENFIVNGTGRFVVGGPLADTGLTGRKIIVDTYGGYARHGGGAFSGKDPSKVDRSAAYMARHIAKNIVAAKIASSCEIQLAYSIGVANPISVNVNTFDKNIDDHKLSEIIKQVFPLKPGEIISYLDLKSPIYTPLSAYGHFGRKEYSWENINMVDEILKRI